MHPWPEADILSNGIRLHYYRTGGDKPPVVLCHGWSDYGLSWSVIARALEPDYDVIMVDARGHGLSDAPESGYASEDHAADIAGVIQALGLIKKHAAVANGELGTVDGKLTEAIKGVLRGGGTLTGSYATDRAGGAGTLLFNLNTFDALLPGLDWLQEDLLPYPEI